MTGRLIDAGTKAGISGMPIMIYGKLPGSAKFIELGRTDTVMDGQFSFSFGLTVAGTYQLFAEFPGIPQLYFLSNSTTLSLPVSALRAVNPFQLGR